MKVVVSGTGLLSTAVLDTLEDRGGFIISSSADGPDIDVVITASDAWDTGLHEPARELATRHGAALLTVHTELGTVVIGPTERPGVAGCTECIRRRRSITPADARQRSAVLKKYRSQLTGVPSKQLDPLAADTVAAVVADDVARMAVGQPGEPRTQGAVLMFDLTEHTVATHRFLPDPRCPVCGTLPDDSAELADLRTRLRPRPKPDREVYRLIFGVSVGSRKTVATASGQRTCTKQVSCSQLVTMRTAPTSPHR